ncbi:MAG: Rieske 2Fe-2S domain-containing protein [Rhodospirillaceae bacterium]|nr:Rieske 2Fe-2S domain-containing protein [Rhodospirillaceae bacterium]
MTRELCQLADLEATGAKEIVFIDEPGARTSVFVVKHGGTVRGYVNSCPHARLPLNFRDDQFFDVTKQYILCANHAAYFDIQTGQCVRGPCKGKSLQDFPVTVSGQAILQA